MMKQRYGIRRFVLALYSLGLVLLFASTRLNSLRSFMHYREYYQWQYESCGHHAYNLVPFWQIARYITRLPSEAAVQNLFGLLVIMIVFGILLRWSFPKCRLWQFALAVFVICAAANALKMFSFFGVFDIDDCIIGTVGAVIGYGIYEAIKKVRS